MIAFVNSYERYTGLGKYAFSTLERMKDLGHDIPMIFLKYADGKPLESPAPARVIRQRRAFPKYNALLAHYFYFPKRIPAEYELYHLGCQYYAKSLKTLKKCVLTHMDVAPLVLPQFYSPVERLFYRLFLKLYSLALKIIVLSEQSRGEVLRFSKIPEDKIHVIPLGYDENMYKPQSKNRCRDQLNLPQNAKIVLYVGREHSPRKNTRALLHAMNALSKSVPGLMVLKVGASDPRNNDLKQSIHIREIYNVPENLMPVIYNASDIFIFPSLYEGGCAYPPLEAMACGIPAIVSEECKVYGEGAMVVDAAAPENIKNRAEEILGDKTLREKYSQSALIEAKKYTLTQHAQRVLNLYKEILGGDID